MNLDLETRLREEFASVDLDVPVDAEQIVTAGRRLRFARRMGVGIGATAVVVAAAFVALPILGGRTVPASPEPTPASNPSTAASDLVRVDFPPLTDGSGTASGSMLLQRSGGNLLVTTMVVADGKSGVRTFVIPDDGKAWFTKLDGRVSVGLLPARSPWVSWQTTGGGWSWGDQDASLVDRTAYLFLADPDSIDARVTGAIWQEPGAGVRDSKGEDVSYVELSDAVSDSILSSFTVYADKAFGILGVRGAGATGENPLSAGPAGETVAYVEVATSVNDSWMSRAVYLLPCASRNVELTPRKSDVPVVTTQGTLEGGAYAGCPVLSAAIVRDAGENVQVTDLIQSISYTDADGQQVSLNPDGTLLGKK